MRYYYTYYPKIREIEIPDANCIGVFGPLEEPHSDREQILRDAFAHPVSGPKLSEIATAEDKVLIVLDDALEPTPTVFPFFHVVQELHAAGVKDENVTVLIANAGHRASSNAEVDRKIGSELRKKYKVFQSALNEREESYHTFGTAYTASGPVDVRADARLRDASLIIGIGGTYPNRFKGFTGGGSLIFPGLANEETMGEIYLSGASQDSTAILGLMENSSRSLISQFLAFLPAFKFCVDVVVDRTLTISACFAGSPSSVYRISSEAQAHRSNFQIPEAADIVMIDSHPLDTNILQSAHALYAALGILKVDGEIIIVTPLLEQVSQLAGTLAKNLSETKETLLKMSISGALSRHPAIGAQLAAIREVVERASHITFVTNGPGMNDPAKFGFAQSNDAQAALNAAFSRKGSNAKVALITHGGMAVPRVG